MPSYASISGSLSEHLSHSQNVCLDRPTENSLCNDGIVCLECGFVTKRLRRHLASKHTITPAQYRAKWHLPSDYPMTFYRTTPLR
ncbi:MucR family transcriptional regulator [Novosphingobium olei]